MVQLEPRQDAGWVQLSDDPGCALLAPRAIPQPRVWSPPGGKVSPEQTVVVDGQGDVAFYFLEDYSYGIAFAPREGTGLTLHRSYSEAGYPIEEIPQLSPRPSGWFAVSPSFSPRCVFNRVLGPDGQTLAVAPIASGSEYTTDVLPTGDGYFAMTATDTAPQPGATGYGTTTGWVRFTDNDLNPLGDWYSIASGSAYDVLTLNAVADIRGHAWVSVDWHPPMSQGLDTFNQFWVSASGSFPGGTPPAGARTFVRRTRLRRVARRPEQLPGYRGPPRSFRYGLLRPAGRRHGGMRPVDESALARWDAGRHRCLREQMVAAACGTTRV